MGKVDESKINGNTANDQLELPAILEQARLNTGKRIEITSEDAGYFHSQSLEYLAAHGIDGYIPSPQQVSKERQR